MHSYFSDFILYRFSIENMLIPIPECQNEVKRNFGRISQLFQSPKLSVRDSFNLNLRAGIA